MAGWRRSSFSLDDISPASDLSPLLHLWISNHPEHWSTKPKLTPLHTPVVKLHNLIMSIYYLFLSLFAVTFLHAPP